MKKTIRFCGLILCSIATLWASQSVRAQINIVPKPESISVGEGTFLMSAKTPLLVGHNDIKSTGELFVALLEPIVGSKLKVRHGTPNDGAISLELNKSLAGEQYTLSVTPKRISIEGGSARAVFYGLQSLRQLIPAKKATTIEIPAVEINDKPCFAYRGAMLDVVRHIFTMDQIKEFIDILALHKINTFHWHLTDDQGWRIEIKKYPELTKIGAMRDKTLIGHLFDTPHDFDETPYGGFFTQKQIKEIVSYATERHIDVIPEIEMPGHGLGALTTYPWLGCTGGPYKVWPLWGVSDDVYCAGKETTFEFMENVLAEVIELFPSKIIHIGGDECPKERWKECPDCQARMKANALKDENELQSYFMQRIEKWVAQHGRKIIGWDEILDGGISKTATVMSWRGSKGGIAAAKSGNYVIMAPNVHCYLDYFQTQKPEPGIVQTGHFLPIEKVYALDPYASLTPQERKYIIGVQANLWVEYIKTFDHLQYMLLPRLAALSEVGWAYDRKDYDSFKTRISSLRGIYELSGYKYAPYLFE